MLVEHFIDKFNQKLSRRVRGADAQVLRALMADPWKGNVRELEHVIERAMILGDGEILTLPDLPCRFAGEPIARKETLREVSRRSERQHIIAILARTGFDKREAARALGISLASLYRKLGEHDIGDPPSRN